MLFFQLKLEWGCFYPNARYIGQGHFGKNMADVRRQLPRKLPFVLKTKNSATWLFYVQGKPFPPLESGATETGEDLFQN